MAKPMMISYEVYDKLKKLKTERKESFSEVISFLLEDKSERRNPALEALGKFAGTFKDDKEFDEIKKDLEKGWKAWGKKYA